MKPTDEEAAARRVLAQKLKADVRGTASVFERESQRKQPDLDTICCACEALAEHMGEHLAAYDRQLGPSDRTATKFRLRANNKKLAGRVGEQAEIIQRQQAELDKREDLVAEAVPVVKALVALCESHGVAIPPELMGKPPASQKWFS